MTPTLFVDRDGTILVEPADYQIDDLAKVAFVDGAIEALAAFAKAGWRLVLVSNQDGLGTSAFPRGAFEPAHQLMCQVLRSCGVVLHETLICPHLASDRCACRKPRTGLIQGLPFASVDWQASIVVGDRETDREFAEALGLRSFLLKDGLDWQAIQAKVLVGSRAATISRVTKETKVEVTVDLDDARRLSIATGLGFLDHLLTQIGVHAGISIEVNATGDLNVDDHHLVEDVALSLGAAVDRALGDRRAIGRYGFLLPMDEALSQCAIDFSGRPFCAFRAPLTREVVGGLATEMIPHFFRSFAQGARATLHLRVEGENHHHMIEAAFKALGRCLRQAVARTTGSSVPSSKEVL